MKKPNGERSIRIAPSQRHAHSNLTRSWRRALIALAIVVSVLLTASGFYAVSGFTALNDIRRDDTLMPSGAPTSTATGPAPLNFVLMGSDTLGGERGRSDTLMLAHLNAERNKIYLISFPRDMYVTIPGHGEHKINAAYSYGGSALAIETLESLLDLRMDHAVKVEFDGFIRLTEHLGGVTVFNPHASVQAPYTFPRGEISIKGDEALAYVRERYSLPDGDLPLQPHRPPAASLLAAGAKLRGAHHHRHPLGNLHRDESAWADHCR